MIICAELNSNLTIYAIYMLGTVNAIVSLKISYTPVVSISVETNWPGR